MSVPAKLRVEAYIIGGNLVIRDPRRAGEWDRPSQWLVLPAVDTDHLIRASDLDIAVAAIPNPGLFR